jgi:hypothetical protein
VSSVLLAALVATSLPAVRACASARRRARAAVWCHTRYARRIPRRKPRAAPLRTPRERAPHAPRRPRSAAIRSGGGQKLRVWGWLAPRITPGARRNTSAVVASYAAAARGAALLRSRPGAA